MPQPLTFGALLKHYRQAAGLTQAALAERAGYSTVYISMLERGERTPVAATVELLATALGLAPRGRAALHDAVRRATPATPEHNAASKPSTLVGRAHELMLLERHLAADGLPVLLLAGEPGIGKTRLLRETAMRAATAGLSVLQGGCQRRGGQEPYMPVLAALKSHMRGQDAEQLRADLSGCAWLVRMLPELADGPIEPLPVWALPPAQERRLMFDAVARFLSNVAGPAGTLLVLDDLQWADPDALDLLAALARAAAEIPLRIVGAYRDTEAHGHAALSSMMADLAHAELAAHITLGPLAPTEAEQLFGYLLEGVEGVDDALRERVLQRAGGLPFYLVSCARALRMSTLRPGTADEIPWDAAQTILQRAAALPPHAREMVDVAAVAGRVVPRGLVLAVVARDQDQALDGLEMACRARLLQEEGGDSYRFLHDLAREVLEADLGAARRTALHRRIAEALELEEEPAVEALAYHYARSEMHDKAVLYLERAGDRAAALCAHVAAEGYYRELVDRLDGRGRIQQAARAREKLGGVLTTVARYDAALDVLDRAAGAYHSLGDAEGERSAVAQIGRVHGSRATTPQEGIARLQGVLAAAQPDDAPSSPGVAALYAALARLLFMTGRYAEQLDAAERAVALARALGDERILSEAEGRRAAALGMLGRVEESIPALEQAIELAESVGDLNTLCHSLNNLAATHLESGEIARCLPLFRRGLALAEKLGDPVQIAFQTCGYGETLFYQGAWSEARAYLERAVSLSRRVGASWGAAYPLIELGHLSLAEGRWEDASRHLQESLSLGDLQGQRQAQRYLAELDLLQRRPQAVQDRFASLLDRPGMEEWDVTTCLPILAWAHLELGDVAHAADTVAQAMRRARAERHGIALVEALRVQALVALAQGRFPDAQQALEEGITLARSMPYPYAEGRLLHVYGELRLRKGESEPAQKRLEEALSLFRRLGARHDAERATTDQQRTLLSCGTS